MSARRKVAIDALRGLVMVLMALDHVRDYFTPTAFDPIKADHTTLGWFATRWVTHLCAPVFVFLAGTSAWLKGHKSGATDGLSGWLVRRGLWIVLVELLLNNAIWFSSLWYQGFYLVQLQVLWAIGWSMVCLGLLCRLPRGWVGVLALLMIAGHNLLDGIELGPESGTALRAAWGIIHVNTQLGLGQSGLLMISYPLVPWIGVMAAGWWFGGWYEARQDRARSALWLGLALCTIFALLRYANVYGDPRGWSTSERGSLYTLLDFFDCQKYPPSLSYLLMTLGPAMVLLALFELVADRFLAVLVVFGRVPMFYYLLHVAVIHGAAVILALSGGRALTWWWGVLGGKPLEGYEPSLGYCYCVWALVVAALYPVCLWWGHLKATRRSRLLQLF